MPKEHQNDPRKLIKFVTYSGTVDYLLYVSRTLLKKIELIILLKEASQEGDNVFELPVEAFMKPLYNDTGRNYTSFYVTVPESDKASGTTIDGRDYSLRDLHVSLRNRYVDNEFRGEIEKVEATLIVEASFMAMLHNMHSALNTLYKQHVGEEEPTQSVHAKILHGLHLIDNFLRS